MSSRRFRYPLEPVLLTRQWTLDALLLCLAEQNAQIHTLGSEVALAKAKYCAACAEWQAVAIAGESHTVQRFTLAVSYLGDLAHGLDRQAKTMAQLCTARDETLVGVVNAQRALDASKEHRSDMNERFMCKYASANIKLADDQWNILQMGAIRNGY